MVEKETNVSMRTFVATIAILVSLFTAGATTAILNQAGRDDRQDQIMRNRWTEHLQAESEQRAEFNQALNSINADLKQIIQRLPQHSRID